MRRAPFFHSLVLSAVVACAPTERKTAAVATPTAPFTVSIFATNDVHGELRKLPYLAGFLDALRTARARDGAAVVVDAGDAIQGTLESNLDEGAAVMSAFNAMGYTAMALGNHEFDFGPVGSHSSPASAEDDVHGALEARIREARFPVVSQNLTGDDGRLPAWQNLHGSILAEVRGIRFGIVGLLTRDAEEVVKHPLFMGLHTTPLEAAATDAATALRKGGADLVVVVAHAGGACKSFDDPRDLSSCAADSEIFRLARALRPGLVDVIVGGHVDAGVAHFVNGIAIVQAPSHLVAFSRVDVSFDREARRVREVHVEKAHPVCSVSIEAGCNPGSYEGAPVVPNAAVAAAVEPALAAARALSERPLGVRVLATFPIAKSQETALGDLFVDSIREAAGADAAFANAGSIRAELPEGDLTYGKLFHVMPFDNQLARLRLTGAELGALVLFNLTQTAHGMLSVSGVTAKVECSGVKAKLALFRPNGERIRDDETLVVATNDFLALGGDGLLASIRLPADRVDIDPSKTVFDALVEGLAKRKAVSPSDAAYGPQRNRLPRPGQWPPGCGP